MAAAEATAAAAVTDEVQVTANGERPVLVGEDGPAAGAKMDVEAPREEDGAEDIFGIGALDTDVGAEDLFDMLMDLGLETSCPVVGAPSRASDLEQDLGLESSMPVARAPSRRVDGVSCLGNLLQEFGLESGSSACVAQAALSQAPPVRQRIPAGIENRSHTFQVLASQAAARARAERAQERKAYDRLADAWDQMVVRHGDLAQRDGTASGRPWVHRNTYTTRGVLQLGFKEVGAYAKRRGGIDATSKGLDALLTIAAAARKLCNAGASAVMQKASEGTKYMAAILNRGYDSTPEFLRFGRLQTVLAEKARYLKRIEPPPGVVLGYDRWKTISYE